MASTHLITRTRRARSSFVMVGPTGEKQQHVVLSLLVLFISFPAGHSFPVLNINNQLLRSCTAPRVDTLDSVWSLSAALAGEDESGKHDVIAGSNQLEGWKGTVSSADAPTEMGRPRASTSSGAADGSADDSPAWRVEAAATTAELLLSFQTALAVRESLMRKLLDEQSDCYRLFHGAVEGCPGLTVDRYGTVVLVQTFRDPPADFSAEAVEEICRLASKAINAAETVKTSATPTGINGAVAFLPVWNDRRKREPPRWAGEYDDAPQPHRLSSEHDPLPGALGIKVGLENGVRYPLAARHRGIDPWLFLDLRAARKWMLNNSDGMEVLNLFSYTGGVAAAAACGGAASVWNVDFSASAHEVGRASLKLNAALAGECKCEWIKRDVLPTIRQLAGTPTKDYRADRRGRNAKIAGGRHSRDAHARRRGGGGGRHNKGDELQSARGRGGDQRARGSGGRSNGSNSNDYGDNGGEKGGKERQEEAKDFEAKKFDIVFLDPPTWSKSSHGAVDLVRDYQTLFKPSLLATKEGGAVVATNHVSTVDCAEWVDNLSKCAAKAGRTVKSVQVLLPEDDFPSPDGRHPLKIAIVRV